MSYAVIKTGGKQYRVEEGQTLLVERLPGDVGATVELQPLLLAGDGDPVFEGDGLSGAVVQAEVVAHERGPKLRVFKFKPKRGYRRRTGHRQELTRIRVTSIGGAKPKRASASRSRKKAETTEEAS
jgi:large subunit ribosomal protein L21